MTFIGISANQKDFGILKSQMNVQNKFSIIPINDDNIQNLQNIKFDTFIIHDKMIINKNRRAFEKICQGLQYLLINFDKNMNIDILRGNQVTTVITYGLNHKSTVTASSIREDRILVALQRVIFNKYGELQEIGEHKIETIENLDIYGHMLLFIIKLLYK